jgi:hypothetical protein
LALALDVHRLGAIHHNLANGVVAQQLFDGTPAAAMLSFSGASIAAYLVAWRAGRLQSLVAFGPYLAGAIVVGLALGSWI